MITVVTPCFNIKRDGREEFFRRMMQSIHEQSYRDIEHIIIDGGSDDGTLELLDEYKNHGWIDVLISEKDSGVYAAMNKGLKLARGKYINIMNTDDYPIDNEFFSESVLELERSGSDFSHADKIIQSRSDGSETIKKGNERAAFFRMPFRHQTMIVKNDVYDSVGLYSERYRIASDYDFVLRMLLEGKKGVYIPKTYIRSLDGGISSDRETCIKEVPEVIYERYGKNFGLSREDCRAIYLRKPSFNLLFKILRIQDQAIRKSLFYGFAQGLLGR
jgi:glycosyltransferase involved in cell wall biosynthesis